MGCSGEEGRRRGRRMGVSGVGLVEEEEAEEEGRESWEALREEAASWRWESTKEEDRSEGE